MKYNFDDLFCPNRLSLRRYIRVCGADMVNSGASDTSNSRNYILCVYYMMVKPHIALYSTFPGVECIQKVYRNFSTTEGELCF